MSDRSARIIIVCEDTQQHVFARRVLMKLGVPNHDLHWENAPRGMSDAKQWIREKGLPAEWAAFNGYCRKNSKNRRVLFVVSDADEKTAEQRIVDLAAQCNPTPGIEDHVCFVVPKWAIETWFKFLRGEPSDEGSKITRSDKYPCARDCWDDADRLAMLCEGGSLPANAPASLRSTCERFAKIRKQLR